MLGTLRESKSLELFSGALEACNHDPAFQRALKEAYIAARDLPQDAAPKTRLEAARKLLVVMT